MGQAREPHPDRARSRCAAGSSTSSACAASGPDVAGIVSATRGNHGQSLGFAGRLHGLPVAIVVPHGNSAEKNASMAALGAELIVHGEDFQAAREHARVVADERGFEMVESFHPDLVLGVATYAHELFTAVPAIDTVYVPVGMGSGICGLIGVRDLLGLPTEIVGVVAEGAPATLRSFEAGHVVSTEAAATFVDGVACRVPDADAVAAIVAGAARIVAVPDDATREAMRVLHRCTHSAVEPSGAIALAAATIERDRIAGTRVAVILSGGNADTDLLVDVLSGVADVGSATLVPERHDVSFWYKSWHERQVGSDDRDGLQRPLRPPSAASVDGQVERSAEGRAAPAAARHPERTSLRGSEGLCVVLAAQVGDLVLAHDPAQRVLELGELDEQVVLGQ